MKQTLKATSSQKRKFWDSSSRIHLPLSFLQFLFTSQPCTALQVQPSKNSFEESLMIKWNICSLRAICLTPSENRVAKLKKMGLLIWMTIMSLISLKAQFMHINQMTLILKSFIPLTFFLLDRNYYWSLLLLNSLDKLKVLFFLLKLMSLRLSFRHKWRKK